METDAQVQTEQKPPHHIKNYAHLGGRPTLFEKEMLPKVTKLAKIGATDREIADFIGISPDAFYDWLANKPKFSHAINKGKSALNQRVKRSLYHRAVGYTYDEEKAFSFQGGVTKTTIKSHVAPDVNAAIFWLKNKLPDEFQDKIQTELTGELTLLAQTVSSARQRLQSARQPRQIEASSVKHDD